MSFLHHFAHHHSPQPISVLTVTRMLLFLLVVLWMKEEWLYMHPVRVNGIERLTWIYSLELHTSHLPLLHSTALDDDLQLLLPCWLSSVCSSTVAVVTAVAVQAVATFINTNIQAWKEIACITMLWKRRNREEHWRRQKCKDYSNVIHLV